MCEYFYFRDPYTFYSENFERKNKLQRNLFEPAKACSITAALHIEHKLAIHMITGLTSTVFQPQVALFFFCGHILDSKSAFS